MEISAGLYLMRNGQPAEVFPPTVYTWDGSKLSESKCEAIVAFGVELETGNLLMWCPETGLRVPDGIAPHQDLIERLPEGTNKGGGEGSENG